VNTSIPKIASDAYEALTLALYEGDLIRRAEETNEPSQKERAKRAVEAYLSARGPAADLRPIMYKVGVVLSEYQSFDEREIALKSIYALLDEVGYIFPSAY
jgi:hypothetical protein